MVSAYICCILVFLFLYIIVDLFSHLDDILKDQVALSLLINYYLSFIPLIYIQVSPMACLLSLLYSIGTLSKNNEIIAMRASGLSIWRISQPVLIFGFIISILIFMVNERFLPKAQQISYRMKNEIFEKNNNGQPSKMYNLAIYGQNNRHFVIDIYYPKKQMMENVTMLEHDKNQNVVSKTVARYAYFRKDSWLFRKCVISYFNQDGQLIGEPFYFENKFMRLDDRPADFLRQQQQTAFMNIAQLKDYVNRLSKSGAVAVIRNLKVDLYNRYSYPFTSFIIILVGIPFALGSRKRGQAIASLGVCIGISFIYYVFNQTSIAFGKTGLIPPIISAVLSHGVFISASLFAVRRLS